MALAFGYPSVRKLQQELSSSDFADWMAYAQIEPFDETRKDWRAARIAQEVHASWSGRMLDTKEFMPKFDGKYGSRIQSGEEIQMRFFAHFRSRIRRTNGDN